MHFARYQMSCRWLKEDSKVVFGYLYVLWPPIFFSRNARFFLYSQGFCFLFPPFLCFISATLLLLCQPCQIVCIIQRIGPTNSQLQSSTWASLLHVRFYMQVKTTWGQYQQKRWPAWESVGIPNTHLPFMSLWLECLSTGAIETACKQAGALGGP